MSKMSVCSIHVWFDESADSNPWCVSEVDSDAEEIRCSDSYADLGKAWEAACDLADNLSVPAIEMNRQGQAVGRYEPSDASLEE